MNGQELKALPDATTIVRARGIRDEDIGALARFRQLRTFDLAGGVAAVPQRITVRGFEALARLSLPALREVTVSHYDKMTDEAVREVASIPTLRILYLARCGPFGVEAVRCIAEVPNLEDLDLRGCKQLGDDCVPYLAGIRSLKARRALRVTETSISPEGIRKLQTALGASVVDVDTRMWRLEDMGNSGVATEE